MSTLALASLSNAQTDTWRSDTLATGTGYAQDAYFHLEKGQVATVSNNNWDLAFPGGIGSFMRHTVHINNFGNQKSGKLMLLTGKNGSDFGTDLTADTAGKSAIHNIPSDWEEGAFGVAMGGVNPAWGTYNSSDHNIYGDKIYAYIAGGQAYQIFIQMFNTDASVAGREWTIKVAKLDGSDTGTYSIKPSPDYLDKHLVYFNLETRTVVDRDPAYADWHLLATKYGDNYGSSSGAVMSTTGILTSPAVEVAKAANLLPDSADHNNFLDQFSEDRNVIGGSYKAVDYAGNPPGWVVFDSLSYFIKVHLGEDSGDIYQVYFNYFPSATSGDVKIGIQIRKVSDFVPTPDPISVRRVHQNISSLTIAPNPSHSGATNILIDATKNLGPTTINVVDMSGRTVNTFNQELAAGLNHLRLDVSKYPAGMYVVMVENNEGRQSVKLVVQK